MGKSYRYDAEEYEEVEFNRSREKFRRSNRKMKRSQQEFFIDEGSRILNEEEEKKAIKKFYS